MLLSVAVISPGAHVSVRFFLARASFHLWEHISQKAPDCLGQHPPSASGFFSSVSFQVGLWLQFYCRACSRWFLRMTPATKSPTLNRIARRLPSQLPHRLSPSLVRLRKLQTLQPGARADRLVQLRNWDLWITHNVNYTLRGRNRYEAALHDSVRSL